MVKAVDRGREGCMRKHAADGGILPSCTSIVASFPDDFGGFILLGILIIERDPCLAGCISLCTQ